MTDQEVIQEIINNLSLSVDIDDVCYEVSCYYKGDLIMTEKDFYK